MSEPIVKRISVGERNFIWKLKDSQGNPVLKDAVITKGPDQYIITGGAPPAHSGSSGRVYANEKNGTNAWPEREFFPNVFDLVWTLEEEI